MTVSLTPAELVATEARAAVSRNCLWPRDPAHAPLIVLAYFDELRVAANRPYATSLRVRCNHCGGIAVVA